jgi:hypothetical protein
MLFGGEASPAESLDGNELRKNPPDGGLGGGAGDFGAFPPGESSSGGSCGRDSRVVTACWAETQGACSQTVTMGAPCSASADGWEAKSPSGVGSGFSGGVSSNLSTHWHTAFCGTLPARACPAASKKHDGLCLS